MPAPRRVAAVAAAGALPLALTALSAAPASAHGSMGDPVSRVSQCYAEGPESPRSAACKAAVAAGGTQALYDWNGIRIGNAAGKHRELIPDGKLCSANNEQFKGMDLARADWPATSVSSGSHTFKYRVTAPHKGTFTVYITKPGYDPSQPLAWDDLDLAHPVATATDPAASGGFYTFSGTLPSAAASICCTRSGSVRTAPRRSTPARTSPSAAAAVAARPRNRRAAPLPRPRRRFPRRSRSRPATTSPASRTTATATTTRDDRRPGRRGPGRPRRVARGERRPRRGHRRQPAEGRRRRREPRRDRRRQHHAVHRRRRCGRPGAGRGGPVRLGPAPRGDRRPPRPLTPRPPGGLSGGSDRTGPRRAARTAHSKADAQARTGRPGTGPCSRTLRTPGPLRNWQCEVARR